MDHPRGDHGKPIKDPDAEHPIAVSWRPTLEAIVRRLVARDYTLQGLPAVELVTPGTAETAEAYISDYGETLIELPEATVERE